MVVGNRLTISPLVDPDIAVLLGLGLGDDGRASGGSAADHLKTIFSAAGTPDIAGFLFEHGTLTHVGDPTRKRRDAGNEPAMVDTPKPAS